MKNMILLVKAVEYFLSAYGTTERTVDVSIEECVDWSVPTPPELRDASRIPPRLVMLLVGVKH